jgi:hypothetical protein
MRQTAARVSVPSVRQAKALVVAQARASATTAVLAHLLEALGQANVHLAPRGRALTAELGRARAPHALQVRVHAAKKPQVAAASVQWDTALVVRREQVRVLSVRLAASRIAVARASVPSVRQAKALVAAEVRASATTAVLAHLLEALGQANVHLAQLARVREAGRGRTSVLNALPASPPMVSRAQSVHSAPQARSLRPVAPASAHIATMALTQTTRLTNAWPALLRRRSTSKRAAVAPCATAEQSPPVLVRAAAVSRHNFQVFSLVN